MVKHLSTMLPCWKLEGKTNISNVQMRKPVFLTNLEWPPQLCIQKRAPCNFASLK